MAETNSRINPLDFWQWAYGDFLSNAARGVLAEYIVGKAAGCLSGMRKEWDAADLRSASGLCIEVKSAAYLQTWSQTRPSKIAFKIGERQAWSAETNTYSTTAQRSAHLYVFCVFAELERGKADPLDLAQWFFLAYPTIDLNQRLGNQKSVMLSRLENFGLHRMNFQELGRFIGEFDIAWQAKAASGSLEELDNSGMHAK